MTKKKPDYILLGTIAALIFLGIIILASVSAPYSQAKLGSTYYFLKRQIIFGLIPGLVLGFLAFKIKLSTIKKWAPFLLLGNLFLLAMIFVPGIGLKVEGASRWIDFGFISFQPSEPLKLTFILYLAAWLSARIPFENKAKRSYSKKSFGQTFIIFFVIFSLISLALILQPDISTLAVIFFIALLIYFSSNTPFFHSLLIFLFGIIGIVVLIKIEAYRFNRLLVFLDQGFDPMGRGYQLKQSLIAIGSGGLSGRGLGMSLQKFGFLPQIVSDSIFAVFAEETGFIGAIFLILLFLIFLWRGVKISKEAKDRFCQLVALGITSWIVIQAFVNIGAMLGIMPLTGIPLPFVSYGGSALVTILIAMGILLNISKNKIS